MINYPDENRGKYLGIINIEKNILYVFLFLSLSINLFFMWSFFNKENITKEQGLKYSNIIKSMVDAQNYLDQAANSKQPEKLNLIMNAFSTMTYARLYVENLTELFMSKGIEIDNLDMILNDDWSNLRAEIGFEIMGKQANQESLNSINYDLKYLVKTLPSTYDSQNLKKFKDIFSQLHQQQ